MTNEKTWSYPVELFADDNSSFLVTFPDFEDAITYGDTEQEALLNAEDALREVIAARIADREIIPYPSSKAKHFISVDVNTQFKVSLYRLMQEFGYKKADLRKAMFLKDQKQIDRLLDVKHSTSTKAFDAAFAVFGKRPSLNIKNIS